MANCPKCLNKLSKRKSDNTYHCSRHGFARNVMTYEQQYFGVSGGDFTTKNKPVKVKSNTIASNIRKIKSWT